MIKSLIEKFYANKGNFVVKTTLVNYLMMAFFGAGLLLVVSKGFPLFSGETVRVLFAGVLALVGKRFWARAQERLAYNAETRETASITGVKPPKGLEKPGAAPAVVLIKLLLLVALAAGVLRALGLLTLTFEPGALAVAVCFTMALLVIPFFDAFRLSIREVEAKKPDTSRFDRDRTDEGVQSELSPRQRKKFLKKQQRGSDSEEADLATLLHQDASAGGYGDDTLFSSDAQPG